MVFGCLRVWGNKSPWKIRGRKKATLVALGSLIQHQSSYRPCLLKHRDTGLCLPHKRPGIRGMIGPIPSFSRVAQRETYFTFIFSQRERKEIYLSDWGPRGISPLERQWVPEANNGLNFFWTHGILGNSQVIWRWCVAKVFRPILLLSLLLSQKKRHILSQKSGSLESERERENSLSSSQLLFVFLVVWGGRQEWAIYQALVSFLFVSPESFCSFHNCQTCLISWQIWRKLFPPSLGNGEKIKEHLGKMDTASLSSLMANDLS